MSLVIAPCSPPQEIKVHLTPAAVVQCWLQLVHIPLPSLLLSCLLLAVVFRVKEVGSTSDAAPQLAVLGSPQVLTVMHTSTYRGYCITIRCKCVHA
jgi:hypothetical protein